jgi:hypothetical protein
MGPFVIRPPGQEEASLEAGGWRLAHVPHGTVASLWPNDTPSLAGSNPGL